MALDTAQPARYLHARVGTDLVPSFLSLLTQAV
jgi:hypothetical protein